ncbi:putative acetyltransferase [Schumannella luteola]|uniref:Putative acetyltransferase n=1 Tax=Schumannella luteola TaxID=472059 RepID=A0A852Y6P5_9MICO|nr:putative acetyltransferase [Schumannella luteola]
MSSVPLEIRVDDLSGGATRELIEFHLAGMHDGSPTESIHALDLDGLRAPGMTVWSAWSGERIAGIGALKRFGGADGSEDRGELKSMRVADDFRGTGVGRAILRHIVAEAQACGTRSLWLETGAGESFVPAHRLYASEGFVDCGPFADYRPDPLSIFMTREL